MLLLKSDRFSISFSLSHKSSFQRAGPLTDILYFDLLNWDGGFIYISFEKLVGYGYAGFRNFGRNTAGAVAVLTLCMRIRLFKIFNWYT